MKIVIDIPEEDYKRLKDEGMFGNVTTFKRAIRESATQLEIINKIRDDIVHLHEWAFDREEILKIIDKYKTESEANV